MPEVAWHAQDAGAVPPVGCFRPQSRKGPFGMKARLYTVLGTLAALATSAGWIKGW